MLAAIAAAIASAVACSRESPSPSAHGEHDDPMRCATCHTPEFTETKNPPHPGARPTACGVCHTQSSWKPARAAALHPWWELTGAHAKAAADRELAGKEKQVKCFWCHRGDTTTFKDTKKECVACHAEDRETSTFPGHSQFESTCEDCHSTTAWKPTTKELAPATPIADAGALLDAALHLDAASADASADAARARPPIVPRPPPPRPTSVKPTPTTTPTLVPPTLPPPDVTSRPSRRH